MAVSSTDFGVMPAAASTSRVKAMFCPVLAAFGSMRIALGGDSELDGVLAEVDGFPARETGGGVGAVSAGEHEGRDEPLEIEVGGEGGDPQVVAAQPDRHIAGLQLVVHLVVVPDQLRVAPLVLGDGPLVVRHWLSPCSPSPGTFGPLDRGPDALDAAKLVAHAVLRGHLRGVVEDVQSIIPGGRVGEQDVAVGGVQAHALHR